MPANQAQRGPIYKEAPRPARKYAAPPAYGPPAPAYAPAPKYAPKPEAKLPPQPYQFEYGVADQYTGTNFQAVENQDAEGTVIGKWIFFGKFTFFREFKYVKKMGRSLSYI